MGTVQKFFITALVSLIGLSPLLSFAHSELPDLGDPASLIMSPAEEAQLSKSVLNQIRQSLHLSHDPVVNEYLHTIGYRLVATHRSDPRGYRFFAVEDPRINAFAVPGGSIGVNTGLISASDSESQLAAVVAHEVAHVHLRHIARFMEHMSRVRIGNTAAMLAAAILASQYPDAGTGAMAAAMASSTQSLINFTRENEKEADFVGIQSLAAAGFDPQGMPQFFQQLSQSTRYYGGQIPEFLRTHPLTENRLMEAKRRADAYPYKQVPDSLQFNLVQARVKVSEFANAQQAAQYFGTLLKNKTYRSAEGAQYGYALALLEANRSQEAFDTIEQLRSHDPNQALYRLLSAQALWNMGQKDKATGLLVSTLKSHPNNHPIALSLAEMYLAMNLNDNAIKILHQQSLTRGNDPILYHMLSQAYSQSKDQSNSHRMEAEFRYLIGDLQGALTQLRMADQYISRMPGNTKMQIQARKKEIEKILSQAQ